MTIRDPADQEHQRQREIATTSVDPIRRPFVPPLPPRVSSFERRAGG